MLNHRIELSPEIEMEYLKEWYQKWKMPSYHCKHPTCPEILKAPGYCIIHQPLADANEAERQRRYDQQRDPKFVAFYKSPEWRATREAKLFECPICERCSRLIATDVHHVLSLRERWDLRLVISNLLALCSGCHKRIEALNRRKHYGSSNSRHVSTVL